MKIYYNHDEKNPVFYYMTWRDNGLFVFSLKVPDMDTLQLCECVTRDDDKIFNEATQIDEIWNHQFNLIYKKKGNYDGISRILHEVFGVNQEIIDRAYDRDLERYAIVEDTMSTIDSDFYKSGFYFSSLYDKVKWYLNIWNGDKERAKKYMREHDIPDFYSIDGTLVDVFGECHPTTRFLLHEFHNHWGDCLEKIIEEAVELYPDKNDFDLAFYYTRDKLKEKNYGYE